MNPDVTAIRTEQWRQIVYDCINREPTVSKRQWCQENGIRYRSYMYWQRKFQVEALDRMESRETTLPINQNQVTVPAFADITPQLEALRAEQKSVPTEPEVATLAPELMIQAGSFRIYVNGSIQEATLETVMRVIRHA